MAGDSRFKYGFAVTSLIAVVLLFLLVADFAAISALRKLLESEVYRNAEEEISLVESSIKEPILRRDYAMVEQFLTEWSKQHPHVVGVKAIAPNEFLLFDYSRKLPSAHTFQIKHYVKYGGTTLSRLEAVYDLSAFDERIGSLTVGLIAGSAILASFFGVILWYVLRKTAMVPLEREIVERKKTEEKIAKYAAELEESNRIKDLFTDIMRHDLMNPAGVIRNCSELLYEGENDSGKKELIELIRNNSQQFIEMIENASIYSRLQYLEELDREMLCLGAILKDNILNFTFDLKEKQMRVQFAPEGEYPLKANKMIRDVFSNLISNAIKYGDEGSTVEIGIDDEEGTWLIFVKNSGEKIVDEEKEKIFERFQRAGMTNIKGTGLGLAIAKRIVELHNGSIWVDDNPEGGSIFCVRLPKEG